jgi:nucleoside-diphosphate-sugar epimerase
MDSVVAHVAGPERPGDVHSALADVARVRSDLGFEARVSLADGLQEMVDWYVRDDHRSLSARP